MDDNNKEQEISTLNQVINAAPVHIYWKDIKGKILGFNQTNLKSVGLSEKDVIGKKDTEINCISPFSQDICKK